MNHIIINHDHAGTYYAMFYLLAFLLGFIILLWEGRRRQFPIISWMMVIATAFLFFMAGCRIITFSEAEWSYVWRLESIPYITARSVLGGILFSIPGILLAKRCLRFKQDMLDAFAFVLPAALVVQRLGCLMAGCCYGIPGNLPWSIQYGPGSFAFTDQLKGRLLSANSALSLPVHPVQFYEVICALAIIGLLVRLRKNIHATGNLFIASMGMYGAFRFLLEFVRSSRGESSFIFNRVQWLLLIILPLLILFVLYREKQNRNDKSMLSKTKQNFLRPALYFLFVALLFVFLSKWLGALEIVSMNIVLLPMLGILTWYLFKSITLPRLRLVTLLLPVGSLVLMSQTIIERPQTQGTRISYTTFSGGIMGGSTDLDHFKEITTQSGGGCYDNSPIVYSKTSTTTHSGNHYFTGALGIAHTNVFDRYLSFSFGVNLFAGSHTEDFDQTVAVNNAIQVYNQKNNNYSYSGVKPYMQFETKNFGFGLGLNVGRMRQFAEAPSNHSYSSGYSPAQTATTDYMDAAPAVSLRIGNLSRFFVDYKYNNQFTPTFPVLTHQFAFGFPVDHKGSLVRIGTGSYVGFFIAPSIRAGNNFIVEPFIGLGGGINTYTRSTSFTASINLHYKFNRKEQAAKGAQ